VRLKPHFHPRKSIHGSGFRRTLVRLKQAVPPCGQSVPPAFQTNSREVEALSYVSCSAQRSTFQTNSREVEAAHAQCGRPQRSRFRRTLVRLKHTVRLHPEGIPLSFRRTLVRLKLAGARPSNAYPSRFRRTLVRLKRWSLVISALVVDWFQTNSREVEASSVAQSPQMISRFRRTLVRLKRPPPMQSRCRSCVSDELS